MHGSPKYLATYDLTSVDVLESPPYRALTAKVSPWTRRIGSLLDAHRRNIYDEETPDSVRKAFAPLENVAEAKGLLAVLADIEPEHEKELVEWYDEHLLRPEPGLVEQGRRRRAGSGVTDR